MSKFWERVMRILAIETSGFAGSAAVLEEHRSLASHELPERERSARQLAPAVQGLLRTVGWRPRDVQLIAAAIGPGSFTGLRVGATMAKTFAFATGAALVGVNTLEAIAWQCPCESNRIWTAIDAQRRQVFVAQFVRAPAPVESAAASPSPAGADRWQSSRPPQIMDIDEWLWQLVLGDMIAGPLAAKIAARLPAGVTAATTHGPAPHAIAVGQLGWRLFQAGRRDDPFQFVPQYLRRTAAEEQWERLGRS